MPEPAWSAFGGVVTVVALALVGLARLSATAVAGDEAAGGGASGDEPADATRPESGGATRQEPGGATRPEPVATDPPGAAGPDRHAADDGLPDASDGEARLESMPPGVLLANVALTHGLFGSVVVLAAWVARIPLAALGLGPRSAGPAALALGTGLGVALWLGNEGLAAVARRASVGYSEALRELLAPSTRRGWLVLLGVALPVVAGFEELLFRGVLVGAMATGFGVSPWLLAVGSSLLFGVAHGAQGTAGVVVTGLLGFALAAAFVLTGSLLVVVVAHYLVNALEFVVHERPDPARARDG